MFHGHCRSIKTDTYIGKNCVIGINAIIMSEVIISDQCIIGGGVVVTPKVSSHCIVVGNPTKMIKREFR